jgi:hypothetical protein
MELLIKLGSSHINQKKFMAQEIITLEDLQKFRQQLLDDLKLLMQQSTQPNKEWLKSADVRKMLGISHGTLQNLRINRSLPCQKIGGIFYYKYADVSSLLNGQSTPNKNG